MISKLTQRLLFFNLLLVFFPVAGMLYLDTYEKQLLVDMEKSMVQQGRLIAAALKDSPDLAPAAVSLIKNMEGHHDSRIRIVNAKGEVLADSSSPLLNPLKENAALTIAKRSVSLYEELPEDLREHWLYKLAVFPINLVKRIFYPPSVPLASAEFYSGSQVLMGPEIQNALEGRYGAYTRYSLQGQRSVDLYSALPLYQDQEISAVVLISRSTFKILNSLYSIRLDMVRIFVFSVLVAVFLSILLARTITIPVRKLRDQAESFLDHRGRMKGQFRSLKNKDEIGDLSRSLDRLSCRLEEYIRFMDGFSSDLAHELKNPVASILNASELSLDAPVEDRERFAGLIHQEGIRIQRLIDDLRDMSRMDLILNEEEQHPVALGELLSEMVRQKNLIHECCYLKGADDQTYMVMGNEDRFLQCFSNLLDNALSFSAEDEMVSLSIFTERDEVCIRVEDLGPGIPEGNLDKIFDRFFSDRPSAEKKNHSGLGLSICKTIVLSYGGRISAENREGGGSRFSLHFKLLSDYT